MSFRCLFGFNFEDEGAKNTNITNIFYHKDKTFFEKPFKIENSGFVKTCDEHVPCPKAPSRHVNHGQLRTKVNGLGNKSVSLGFVLILITTSFSNSKVDLETGYPENLLKKKRKIILISKCIKCTYVHRDFKVLCKGLYLPSMRNISFIMQSNMTIKR